MNNYSRVFNFRSGEYLYTSNYSSDNVKTKTLFKKEFDAKLNQNVYNPVFEKIKYGEDAYSYCDFKNKLSVFADNLRFFSRRTTFYVKKQLNGNQDVEYDVGKIKKGKIIPATNNPKDIALLKKFQQMMKKF